MVLDQRGSIVRDFGRVSSAKPVRFAWDGLDWRGQSLPAGSYVVQVVSGSDVAELECGRRSRRPLD
jgi:flagellar hook assembly protein FlgD